MKNYNIIFLFFIILLIHNSHQNKNKNKNKKTLIEFSQDDLDSNLNYIEGKMTINGENYKAICDCSSNSESNSNLEEKTNSQSKCDPLKLTINNEVKGKGASLNSIKKLIGNIKSLEYVDISNTLFKCLDGRYSSPILSTPGGESGEFLNALNILEQILSEEYGKENLNKNEIKKIIKNYLNNNNKIYFCTDEEAINRIENILLIEGLNFKNPRKNFLPDLYNNIIDPENLGDLHLRLMLKFPEKYGIRKELIENYLQSLFEIYWEDKKLKKQIEIEILNGEHSETAFVEIRSENNCKEEGLAPLIKTKDNFISVFVNHIDAVEVLREKLSKFLSSKENNGIENIESDKMKKRLNHHGYAVLEITGSYIAKGLPFDTINLA